MRLRNIYMDGKLITEEEQKQYVITIEEGTHRVLSFRKMEDAKDAEKNIQDHPVQRTETPVSA